MLHIYTYIYIYIYIYILTCNYVFVTTLLCIFGVYVNRTVLGFYHRFFKLYATKTFLCMCFCLT